jgi:hypothetical protein
MDGVGTVALACAFRLVTDDSSVTSCQRRACATRYREQKLYENNMKTVRFEDEIRKLHKRHRIDFMHRAGPT